MKPPTVQEVAEFWSSPEVKELGLEIDKRSDKGDYSILDDYPRMKEEAWTKFLQRTRRAHLRVVE